MAPDEGAQDLEYEAKEQAKRDHPTFLGAPIPHPPLTFSQHSFVVSGASLVKTLNEILWRLDRLEQQITDEKERQNEMDKRVAMLELFAHDRQQGHRG